MSSATPAEVRFSVRVTPRGGADRIEGVSALGELRVRVSVAPAGGAANEALTRLLADAFGVSRSRVRLVHGQTARTKMVAIRDADALQIERRWPGLQTTER